MLSHKVAPIRGVRTRGVPAARRHIPRGPTSPASLGPPGDKVWVYSIVTYSQMWLDLARFDARALDLWTTGPGAESVKTNNLKPLMLST
jgi:hypothetical protein